MREYGRIVDIDGCPLTNHFVTVTGCFGCSLYKGSQVQYADACVTCHRNNVNNAAR